MSMPQPQDPTLSMLDPDGPPATVAEEGKATTYAHPTHPHLTCPPQRKRTCGPRGEP